MREREEPSALRWCRALTEDSPHSVDRGPLGRGLGHPPRGARRAVGCRVGPGRKGGDDVIGLGWVSSPLSAEGGEVGSDLGKLVRVLEVDGEEALVPGRPAQWPGLAVVPRYPDRHAGALHGPRQEPHGVDRVVLAVVLHELSRPGGLEDLERLVEHLSALAVVELLACDRVFAAELVAAEADAKGQAAIAEPVKGRGLARHLDRPAPGEWGDHG